MAVTRQSPGLLGINSDGTFTPRKALPVTKILFTLLAAYQISKSL